MTMGTNSNMSTGKTESRWKHRLSVILSALSTLIFAIVIISVLALSVPRVFGFQMYNIVSGSMEPTIPVGSLIYVKETDPQSVEENDVIAYYHVGSSDTVVAHRVIEVNRDSCEFITKGDANESADLNPVTYEMVYGKVVLHIPALGTVSVLLTGVTGKVGLFGVLVCAFLIQVASNSLADKKEVKTKK